MNHEIYIFGSVTRGEVFANSDVDVLVIPFESLPDSDYPLDWSIYTPDAVREFHQKGRLFSWHLFLEAKCIYTPFKVNLIQSLGEPAPYDHDLGDIDSLENMMQVALLELSSGTNSSIFELGIVYTTLRDIATAASWRLLEFPCFSRYAPYKIDCDFPLERDVFNSIMEARHVATRNQDFDVMRVDNLKKHIMEAKLEIWVKNLKQKLSKTHFRKRLKLKDRSSI